MKLILFVLIAPSWRSLHGKVIDSKIRSLNTKHEFEANDEHSEGIEERAFISFDSKEHIYDENRRQTNAKRDATVQDDEDELNPRIIHPDKGKEASDDLCPTTNKANVDIGNRDPEEMRALLTNMSLLEHDNHITDRDYGSSYILPVLKAVKYDNTTIPTVFPDVPVNVRVLLHIIHLANFDSIQMEYSIDVELEMRWFDIRLSNHYSKSVLIREMSVMERIWTPDPYFVNSKYSYFHMVSFPNFRMRVDPTGLVTYTLRVTLLPACQMIFCRFPHDRQQCDLRISSIAFSRKSLRFSWHSSRPVRFVSPVTLPELRIASMLTHECHVEQKLIDSSCLRLVFNLQRDGARFIVEKYIPSTLAMMFAWVAPYVPYNYEEVRIITPITVLLTLVQMEKGDQEVRTSYITSMDTWFGAMKAFSVISLLESLAVLSLIKTSRAMERQIHKATNRLEEENFMAEKKRLTKMYHRLDSIARLATPCVFVLFFIYYILFVAQGDELECINK